MAAKTHMWRKLGRLFTIKTRWEAWFVIYAIALGSIERGRHYLEIYPGASGWMLALACTGVVFLAGGKLLDSVPKSKRIPAVAMDAMGPYRARFERRPMARRNRPTHQPRDRSSRSRFLRRTD